MKLDFIKIKNFCASEVAKALDEVGTDLAGSENGYVAMIGRALQGLSDVLEWLTKPDTLSRVENFFNTLIAVWAGTKAMQAVGNIAAFAGNFATLSKASGSGLLSGGVGEGVLTLSVAELAISALSVSLIAAGFSWAADRRNNHPEDVRGTDENLAAVAEEASEDGNLRTAFVEYVEAERALQEFLNSGQYDGENGTELFEAVESTKEAFQALEGWSDLWDAYSAWRQEHSNGNMSWELPADWWQSGAGQGLTSDDISGFKSVPGLMKAAVREGVSNIKVVMDGQTVGNIVAPYVSEKIAPDMA